MLNQHAIDLKILGGQPCAAQPHTVQATIVAGSRA